MSDAALPSPLGLLLLEDSPADSRLLVESLRDRVQQGTVVIQTVRRLADALRELRRFRFSCVLVDLGLPDGQGVANVARIREADADIAIVVLTGLSDPEAAANAIRLGAQGFLTKGERLGAELLEFVDQAVARRAAERGLPATSEAQQQAPAVLRYRPWVDPTRNRFAAIDCQLAGGWREQRMHSGLTALLADLEQWRQAGVPAVPLSLQLEGETWGISCNELTAAVLELGISPEQICVRVDIQALGPASPALDPLQRLRAAGFNLWVQGWSADQVPLERLLSPPCDAVLIHLDAVGQRTQPNTLRFLTLMQAAAGALGLPLILDGVGDPSQQALAASTSARLVAGTFYCDEQSGSVMPLRWRRGPGGLDSGGAPMRTVTN